jgi:hypothetical protein
MRGKNVTLLWLVGLLTIPPFPDAAGAGTKGFAERFTGELLRVDVVHSGNAVEEEISFRRALCEPVWGGPRRELAEPADRGEYVLEMRDASSGTVLYRQGFSTLFGEWRTTLDDTTPRKAFEETYELPFPRKEIRIRVARRGKGGEDQTVLALKLDPAAVERSVGPRAKAAEVLDLMINGDPQVKVDLVFLGDGYTDAEAEKFAGDCRRVLGELLAVEPFAGMRDRFNARAVRVPSAESGVDEPRKGIFRDTVFGMSFDTFGIERYCMTEDVWAVHDAAALVPHDAVLLMANTSRYGGGAVYNFYTAFASDNEYGDYLCVHEFGHGFGGLGDEYYSSQVSYNEFYPRGVEPWEPNITALLDAHRVKWGDLIEAGTPIPTPFEDERYRGKTGVFEGAGYAAKGLYRPAADCKMFSKANRKFCAVCSRALADTIRRLTSE